MIIKAELDRLRAQRPQHNARLDYTIHGPVEAHVHSCVESERIGKLNQGDRRLAQALEELRRDYALSSHEGLARAHFNTNAPVMKP